MVISLTKLNYKFINMINGRFLTFTAQQAIIHKRFPTCLIKACNYQIPQKLNCFCHFRLSINHRMIHKNCTWVWCCWYISYDWAYLLYCCSAMVWIHHILHFPVILLVYPRRCNKSWYAKKEVITMVWPSSHRIWLWFLWGKFLALPFPEHLCFDLVSWHVCSIHFQNIFFVYCSCVCGDAMWIFKL